MFAILALPLVLVATAEAQGKTRAQIASISNHKPPPGVKTVSGPAKPHNDPPIYRSIQPAMRSSADKTHTAKSVKPGTAASTKRPGAKKN
jgi:hypothetical protein